MSRVYIDICDNLKMFYILENKKKINNRKIKKVINFFLLFKYRVYSKYNIINKKNFENNLIYVIYSKKECNLKKIEKVVDKKLKYGNIILSKKILMLLDHSNKKRIKEAIKATKDDKRLFVDNVCKVLKYIINLRNENIETSSLYVLVDSSIKYRELLIFLGKNCKSLNIVTNNIKGFKDIEEYMFENYGISIIRTNNKRKALRRAKYVINLEFSQEMICEYGINREAIIFNFTNYIFESLKGFNGIIINNAEFDCIKKVDRIAYIFGRFWNNMYKKSPKLRILNVIGNNGQISFKELIK